MAKPRPYFKDAAHQRQWWKLGLGLAAFLSIPAYQSRKLSHPPAGVPLPDPVIMRVYHSGLVVGALCVVALLLASLVSYAGAARSSRRS